MSRMPIRQAEPVVPLTGGRPVSYQEVPAPEAPYQRALALRVIERLERLSPWRRFVTRTVLRDDFSRASQGRGGAPSAIDPSQQVGGPADLLTAYWLPRNHTAPAPPADVAWDTNPGTAQPAELLVTATMSDEDYGEFLELPGVVDGAPAPGTSDRPDPVLVDHLADALVRGENLAFAAGAGSNADPVRGLANIAGLTTFAAAAAPYVDDLYSAVAKLRAAKRRPNAAFIGAGLYKVLRAAKGAGGGSYLFDPSRPIVLDDGGGEPVPVVVLDGIPDGAATVAFVGDFRQLVATHRIMPNGLLAMVARSEHALFTTDQVRFRAAERWDLTPVPNVGPPSIVKISAINAPAP